MSCAGLGKSGVETPELLYTRRMRSRVEHRILGASSRPIERTNRRPASTYSCRDIENCNSMLMSNFHILADPWQPNDALFHIQCRNILTSRLIDLQNERNNVEIFQRVIEMLDSEFDNNFRKLVFLNISRPLAQKPYTIR